MDMKPDGIVNVDQIRALGKLLRGHLKGAIAEDEQPTSPLLAIIGDVQARYDGFTPKYATLAAALKPVGQRYGLTLPDDDREGHARIMRYMDDAKSGYAKAFGDTLLHHYWSAHRDLLLDVLHALKESHPALAPFVAARQAGVPAAIANLHESARRSLLPRRSYSAKDWEIAAHRIAKERSTRSGKLTFAQLEIDALPDAVLDMDWLTNLDCCSTLITNLPAMCRLHRLQTLDCSYTPLAELPSLRGCDDLIAIWCGVTNINDLSPLADCGRLRVLYCGRTLVGDLSPLGQCKRLEVLHCEETNVEKLSGLETCEALKTLDCQDTEVDDLSPLGASLQLETLILNGCRIAGRSDAIWSLPSLQQVLLFRGELADVPPELLSRSFDDNCLQRVRSHLGVRPA